MSEQVSVFVQATYYCSTQSRVTLPEGKVWSDVAEWYVKWDALHLVFKGGSEWVELDLHTDWSDGEAIDTKRPTSVTILAADEDDEPNYAGELASN
jgi:hypothetical protein